jgi:hypothetical protein
MRSETSEQQDVVRELRRAGIAVFAVPNGARRDKREQVRFKREGGSSGVPDLNIPYPCGGWPGAVVEMKRERKGVVSANQRKWLEHYDSIGWLTIVGQGAVDALQQLSDAGYPVRVPSTGSSALDAPRSLWRGSATPGVAPSPLERAL